MKISSDLRKNNGKSSNLFPPTLFPAPHSQKFEMLLITLQVATYAGSNYSLPLNKLLTV